MSIMGKSDYRNSVYMLILLFADTSAYLLAVVLAYFTRILAQNIFGIIERAFPLEYFIIKFVWIYLIYIIIIASQGLYIKRIPFWKESLFLVRSVTITFLLAFAIVSLLKLSDNVSRFTLVFIWFYCIILCVFFRYILKGKLFSKSFFKKKAIIVGGGNEALLVAERFNNEHPLGFNVIGVVVTDKYKQKKIGKYKILGSINNIDNILVSHDVSTGIFLSDALKYPSVSEAVGRLQLLFSQIIVVTDLGGIPFSNAEINQTLTTQVSYFQIHNNLKSWVSRFIKRTIDLLLCIISLPVLLVVVFIIGLLIKLTSKGPVFYLHDRVGRNGKTIKIIKFRSMYEDADERLKKILENSKEQRKEWESSYKLKDDPRITSVGRFLRKTSLDELPQVFNVIAGHMSLIGPRPVVPYELETYYKDYASYYLMVRPGITGLWQISGRSNTGYDFRVSKDTWYVLNWSPWLDIVILLKTPLAVLKQDGAY